jgi:crotonobetainyl-CoA:carnitine CoA-transferase CaiB-like acyl-CoA transferase
MREQHPALVILSISDFGRGSRHSRWQATAPVIHALTSELSRSGIPGRDPLIPPGDLPYHVAAAQAALMAVTAFLDRQRTGQGDVLDFSVLEGAMQALDPPFGMTGSAATGVPLRALPRGRPEARHMYPIIPCKDGYTRICVLARRQWHGMFAWMGQPAEFADPRFDDLRARFSSPALLRAITAFFADKTRAELEAAGQEHGVPTAAVLTLAEALATEQVKARRFLREAELAPGLAAPVPAGVAEIDGSRASALLAPARASAGRPGGAPILDRRRRACEGRPLEGIRVLDLGVIVVGGDTGRLFGDLGADVIKIENSAFPDGARSAMTAAMLPGFAAGHRNKRSIGINLRDPEGRELVRRLVAVSDIVLTNFKPGVIESLGLDYHALRDVNPGIVVTVRGDADWAALCTVTGRADLGADPGLRTRAGRAAGHERIDAAVRDWSARHSPVQAMELLQAAGVPAGAMLRAIDLPGWGYYQERRAFREETHPHGSEPWVMENVQVHSERVADPPPGHAPLPGEQTSEIAAELLGLSPSQVRDLVSRGVLETAPLPDREP